MSGRLDLNSRPPAPKLGRLHRYKYYKQLYTASNQIPYAIFRMLQCFLFKLIWL